MFSKAAYTAYIDELLGVARRTGGPLPGDLSHAPILHGYDTAAASSEMLDVIEERVGGAEPAQRTVYAVAMCHLLAQCVWLLAMDVADMVPVLRRVLARFPVTGELPVCSWGVRPASPWVLPAVRHALARWPDLQMRIEDVIVWRANNDPRDLARIVAAMPRLARKVVFDRTHSWSVLDDMRKYLAYGALMPEMIERGVADGTAGAPEWVVEAVASARFSRRQPWLAAVAAHTYTPQERRVFPLLSSVRRHEREAERYAGMGRRDLAQEEVRQAREIMEHSVG